MNRTDVVVVGAGPTGLLLAAELALRGIEVTVLERLEEPDPTIKAGSINVASAEILDRRGLLPGAEEIQNRFAAAAISFAGEHARRVLRERLAAQRFPVAGHFAGILFRPDLVDQDDLVLAAHNAVGGAVLVPQHDLELLLGAHCAKLGVEIRRGIQVRGVRLAGDDADVVVQTSAGDLTAGWVVAADGGRSVIRKQLGIAFDGTDPELVGYQAIADFDDPNGLGRGWTWTPRGIYAYGPLPGRILVARFGPQPADRDAPVTVDELQEVVRDVTGVPVTITGLQGRATRWSDNTRHARSYRHGRALLAGDAAHVHAPFSGQGLNLGLGDAANLGWKLAATIQGWAPDGLLDTYETERHPIAAAVLDWTRAQVALMRGDRQTEQLRRVIDEQLLNVPGVMNHMVALTAGILQHYDVGDATPPAGSIAGDVELAVGGRIADHAHDGRFVLVDRTPDGRFAGDARDGRVAYVADPWPGVSLLMRPDGAIAWATTSTGDDAGIGLAAALHRWAGSR